MVTAKLGKPYIKELHANRELSVVVTTLMDGSLYFGSGNAKQKKLTEVATLLGYATQQNSNLFTGIRYTQNHIYATSPTKQLHHIEAFSHALYDAKLLESTLDMQASIQDLFKRIHKPSLVFIIGDFLEEIDLSLLAQKHEVIAIIVRDKEEESPIHLGEVTLTSPQDKTTIETYFAKRSITKYLAKLKEHDEKLMEHFSNHDIRYVKIFTDDEVIGKLISLFV